jgi:hypothetical protein
VEQPAGERMADDVERLVADEAGAGA